MLYNQLIDMDINKLSLLICLVLHMLTFLIIVLIKAHELEPIIHRQLCHYIGHLHARKNKFFHDDNLMD